MLSPSRTISVSINRPPDVVYAFIYDPRNLPAWAHGLCQSVRNEEGQWVLETPQGPVSFRFAEKNSLGVLDHYVTVAPGVEVYVPMRVVPNGPGSEVAFTLFRTPDMSEQRFAEDAALVERDLQTLKSILET